MHSSSILKALGIGALGFLATIEAAVMHMLKLDFVPGQKVSIALKKLASDNCKHLIGLFMRIYLFTFIILGYGAFIVGIN